MNKIKDFLNDFFLYGFQKRVYTAEDFENIKKLWEAEEHPEDADLQAFKERFIVTVEKRKRKNFWWMMRFSFVEMVVIYAIVILSMHIFGG